MTDEIIFKLNQINKKFYNDISSDFDKTRKYNWRGWSKLIQILKSHNYEINNVLDIGCGNGRFGNFVKTELNKEIDYLGIDNNEYLIDIAKENNLNILNIDFVDNKLNLDKKFDLIVCFGVMHHIPSSKKRIEFLQNLKNHLSDKGILCVSYWKFFNDDRLKNKIINWSELGIENNLIEVNDYLLNWDRGNYSIRYCHYHDNEEIENHIKLLDLELIEKYDDEGKNSNLNTYIILKKE